ncbi:Phosphoadenosine phosphosulphate reductase domain-containing protein [uncultured Thiomicrorhabdus sp.]
MKTAYIAKWSGGKDSTYVVDELLRRGEPLDEVIFCDTGFEFPEMYDYIEKCKAYWEAKYPELKITLLNWGKGREIWDNHSQGKISSGKLKGQVRGWPREAGMGWCTTYLKIMPTDKYIKANYADSEVFYYIGIAFDEPKRVPVDWKNMIYPMVTWQVTEAQATEILKERGLHNPLYNHFSRTGCWLCPKQGTKSLAKLHEHYPDLWQELEDMDKQYKELNAVNGFIAVGLDAVSIEVKSTSRMSSEQLSMFDDEQPTGCFCK